MWHPILTALLLGIAALIPRCLGLADFFTTDEAYQWVSRIQRFAAAIQTHQWAATEITEHPGVLTLWLGWFGRFLASMHGIPIPDGRVDQTVAYLAMLRLPLAATNSIVIAVAYLLLLRLVRPSIALLASLMWAASPFLIAFSRLLHVDALLMSFCILSILLLLVAVERWSIPDMQQQPLHVAWL